MLPQLLKIFFEAYEQVFDVLKVFLWIFNYFSFYPLLLKPHPSICLSKFEIAEFHMLINFREHLVCQLHYAKLEMRDGNAV